MTFKDSASWVILSPIEQSIKAKIEKIGVPLKDWDVSINRGILTGYNEAFIIPETKRNEILSNCVDADERERTAELIRPILRGRDIKRFSHEWAGMYLIATHNGISEKGVPKIDIKKYPAVKQHLDSHWVTIEARADQGDTPYNLRSCAYWEDFSKPKIIWGELSDKAKFVFDSKGEYYSTNTTFLMTGENLEWLICFLNSPLSEYLFSKIGSTSGVGTVRWLKFTIEQLAVPTLNSTKQKEWCDLFHDYSLGKVTEVMINRRIYEFCNLTPDEILIVEACSMKH